ncbi:MAG: phosphoglucosamine mutase [Pseudomonadota bacterium]
MGLHYFGTDGIRGRVGDAPMTVEFAVRLASAAATVLAPAGGSVLIGKDTRVSGYLFEAALEAGFVAAGVDVRLIGPLPTPAVAYMTQRTACDFGVMISASHNPYEDNGIKFFDREGGKLSDATEAAIEAQLAHPPVTVPSQRLGRATRIDDSRTLYQEHCLGTLTKGLRLDGLKLVVDAANGAAYKVAPRVFSDLGADVVPIGCSPNGRNINDGCGSTAPSLLQLTVPGVRADAGLALDGDGDRLIMVDHLGRVMDGDQLLYVIAKARQAAGTLSGPVVGTVMSNLGLEHALARLGIPFLRAKVGDRYVLERLRETGGTIGGETSGHLLCLDRTTTGDGIVSALQVLGVMRQTGASLAELTTGMTKYPQVLLNVAMSRKVDPQTLPAVVEAVAAAEAALADTGRVVLRSSGTQALIRVMVEGEDERQVQTLAERLATVVRVATA